MKNKLKIAAISALAGAIAIAATVVGYQDWQVRATAPANPGTGYYRTWADLSSGLVKCITSTGASCFFNPPASSGAVSFQTNGTANGSQSLLDLKEGTNMTLVDDGMGGITFNSSAGGGSSLLLQTNTVNNGSQSLLNLLAGGGVSLTDNGSGGVTITSTAAGATRGIGMTFGATAGPALTAPSTQFVTVPFGCTVVGWNLTVDAGTATVDIWKKAAGPIDWTGMTGTVNTGGTNVTWLSGPTFPADAAGRSITINSIEYGIASVTSSTALVLMNSAGAQFGVTYVAPGTSVPTVTQKIDASALPAVSSGTFAGSTSIGTWTTGVTGTTVLKNDIFGFNLQAVATAKAVSIVLECQQ